MNPRDMIVVPKRIVVTEDEMTALITHPENRWCHVTFGFGPSGAWLPKGAAPRWAIEVLAEMRKK